MRSLTKITGLSLSLSLCLAACTQAPNMKEPVTQNSQNLAESTQSTDNFADLEQEYAQFATQALTQSYLERKINRWLSLNEGTRMVRELRFANYKHPALLQNVVEKPGNEILMNQIVAMQVVSDELSQDQDFAQFLTQLQGDILYVKANASGANNGTSWADAYTDLQSALANASFGDQIWVASGTYTPDGASPGDRNLSFNMVEGVEMYGGFAGIETELNQRDFNTNLTILSGDLNGDDDYSDTNASDGLIQGNMGENAHHVVKAENIAVGLLDGFTIQGGVVTQVNGEGGGVYADHSPISLNHIIFKHNHAHGGGGLFARYSDVSLEDVTFEYNSGDLAGGGMVSFSGSPQISQTTFINNFSNTQGGALFLSQWAPGDEVGRADISNATFRFNYVNSGQGGALAAYQSSFDISQSAFENNQVNMYTAGNSGGAISISESSDNSANTINQTLFAFNNALSGGGIKVKDANLHLVNSELRHNSAGIPFEPGGGGALNLEDSDGTHTTQITHCTFKNNMEQIVVGEPGASIQQESGNLILTNNIIWSNDLDLLDFNATFGGPGSSPYLSEFGNFYLGFHHPNAPADIFLPASSQLDPTVVLDSTDPASTIQNILIDKGITNRTGVNIPSVDFSGNARNLPEPGAYESP